MSIKVQVENEMKTAMKAKDTATLTALRGIKSMLLLAETEKPKGEGLSEAEEIAVLMKAAKQRKDSAAIYAQQNRQDLEAVEMAELAVIERFLPQMMSEEELKIALQAIIERVGATSAKDMGKVIGTATKELAGKAENKKISELVKTLLA